MPNAAATTYRASRRPLSEEVDSQQGRPSARRTGRERRLTVMVITVPDCFATIFTALSINLTHDFTTSFGNRIPATDNGSVITELA